MSLPTLSRRAQLRGASASEDAGAGAEDPEAGNEETDPNERIAAQMQYFLTSDVIYSQRYLPRLLPWLDERRPDVVCLQETELGDAAFAELPVRTPLTPAERTHVYHQYTVRIAGASAAERDEVVSALREEHNIGSGMFYPIPNHRLAPFQAEVELPETANSGVSTTDEPFIIVINKDRSVSFGNAQVPMKDVQKKLRAIFETRKNKQVYIQADKSVDYGTVAQAMGEVRAAGIYSVGLITLPKMGL